MLHEAVAWRVRYQKLIGAATGSGDELLGGMAGVIGEESPVKEDGAVALARPRPSVTDEPLLALLRNRGARRPGAGAVSEMIAGYLEAIPDLREVVTDPEARYFGGRRKECPLVPWGEARLGRLDLEAWSRSQKAA